MRLLIFGSWWGGQDLPYGSISKFPALAWACISTMESVGGSTSFFQSQYLKTDRCYHLLYLHVGRYYARDELIRFWKQLEVI